MAPRRALLALLALALAARPAASNKKEEDWLAPWAREIERQGPVPPPPPSARPLPAARPPAAKLPAAKPPAAKPPIAKPPIAKPPAAKPPAAKPPAAKPPAAKPPVPPAEPPVPPAAPPTSARFDAVERGGGAGGVEARPPHGGAPPAERYDDGYGDDDAFPEASTAPAPAPAPAPEEPPPAEEPPAEEEPEAPADAPPPSPSPPPPPAFRRDSPPAWEGFWDAESALSYFAPALALNDCHAGANCSMLGAVKELSYPYIEFIPDPTAPPPGRPGGTYERVSVGGNGDRGGAGGGAGKARSALESGAPNNTPNGVSAAVLSKDPRQPVLRVWYPAGAWSPASPRPGGALVFAYPFKRDARDGGGNLSGGGAALEYEVFFPPDFDFVKGGKLLGLGGGANGGRGCGGGVDPAECFSFRLMWRAGGEGEAYLYVPERMQAPDFCDAHPPCALRGKRPCTVCNFAAGVSFARGAFVFPRGEWARLRLEVELNAPNRTNGRLAVSLNGRRVISYKKVNWRQFGWAEIAGVDLATWFGGSDATWAPRKDEHVLLRGLRAWRWGAQGAPAGPAAGGGGEARVSAYSGGGAAEGQAVVWEEVQEGV